MRITHLCLAGTVSDGYSYQENMLLKYHSKMGLDVSLITSMWQYGINYQLVESDQKEYYYEGIHVIRLKIKNKNSIKNKFKRYVGVSEALSILHPDILFIHGCQFLDMRKVASYLNENQNVITYVDNHADFSNSGTNIVSKYILHKMIWRHCLRMISPYVRKFYGVLPARVTFLKEVYGASGDRCELLLMGGDDDYVIPAINQRDNTRAKYSISDNDFLIVTGGKIDKAKRQTLLLMKAVKHFSRVKLIIFGPVDKELKEEVDAFVDGCQIRSLGWADAETSYGLFAAADLVVFPGRHSVYWEQVASLGIPMVVKWWEGTDHIDNGGNVAFLYNDSADEIKRALVQIVENKDVYERMCNRAQQCKESFLYSEIARKSIQ